jgi:hypothetical protein
MGYEESVCSNERERVVVVVVVVVNTKYRGHAWGRKSIRSSSSYHRSVVGV